MSTIAVVDDEDRVRSLLTRCLTNEGHHVVSAAGGRAGLALLDEHKVDLMLLDLMMPDLSGMEVLAEMADRMLPPPVIVLSAAGDVAARVRALDRGAVDFVTKPFHVSELIARVRRHVSDTPTTRRDPRYLVAGGIELDLDRRRASVTGEDVVLSEREFGLLTHLMRRRGDVCRRDELPPRRVGHGLRPRQQRARGVHRPTSQQAARPADRDGAWRRLLLLRRVGPWVSRPRA